MDKSNRTVNRTDEAPQYERPVPSDKPYVEQASVPGDNDLRTAADPELAEKGKRST